MGRAASKRQATARKPTPGQGQPGWAWGAGGLAIGLFVALLVHLYHQDRGGVQGLDELLTAPPSTEPPAAGEPEREPPRFEFYRLLPEQEVVVPEPEVELPSRRSAAEGAAAEAAARPDARYYLQAGSFRSAGDADRLKARLALLGIEASIQSVELQGGETWHRVRMGPFAAGDQLNEVRARLRRNRIDTILLKRGS